MRTTRTGWYNYHTIFFQETQITLRFKTINDQKVTLLFGS